MYVCVQVAVDWEIPVKHETRFGLCTSYMKSMKAGETIMCAVKASSIVLPADDKAPILMAGMGTGLAPWRALTQHKVMQKQMGIDVGPCWFFYGARKASTEYLYRSVIMCYLWDCGACVRACICTDPVCACIIDTDGHQCRVPYARVCVSVCFCVCMQALACVFTYVYVGVQRLSVGSVSGSSAPIISYVYA